MAMQEFPRWRGCAAAMLLGALLLAVLTAGQTLPADKEAKAAALPADLAKIPSDGMLILSQRVADLWDSELLKPALQKYGKELEGSLKDFRERFGLSPEQIERGTVLFLSPPPPPEEPLWFVRTVKPYDLAKLVAAVKNVKTKKYKDEMLYVGEKDWTIYPLDDRSLVYGRLSEVNALIDHPQPKTEGNLAAALRLAAGKHSMVMGINIKRFTDSVGAQLPGEVEPFLPLLQAHSATFSADLAADSRAAAVLTFATEKDAKAAIKPAEAGIVLLRSGLNRILAEVGKNKDTKELLQLLKLSQGSLKEARIEQKGATLNAALEIKIDAAAAGLAVAQAMRVARESATVAQGHNNLHQLVLAMHNHHSAMGQFPPQAIYDKNGKPLLSWRVMILPYIEGVDLYKQFHLNEPWDSEHNKKLLAKMPKVFVHPRDEKTLKEHTTYYQGFYGKGAFFEGKQALRFADITDGTSNTIMFVEASKAVPWTKPEDIPYDADKPLPKLGLPGAAGFSAAFGDGSVRTFVPKITERTLRSIITRNAGDLPGPDF